MRREPRRFAGCGRARSGDSGREVASSAGGRAIELILISSLEPAAAHRLSRRPHDRRRIIAPRRRSSAAPSSSSASGDAEQRAAQRAAADRAAAPPAVPATCAGWGVEQAAVLRASR